MQIYLVTNLINGKKYLGKDVRNRKHYLGSGTVLRKAIKKYGRDNFKKEIIEEHNDENKLKEREEYWLLFYDAANNINFYNRINKSNGAPKGRKITQKTRNKISKSLSGDNNLANTSAIFKKHCALDVNGWATTLDGIEDFDFWLKLIRKDKKIINVNEKLVLHRLHSKSNFNTKKHDIISIL